MNSSMVLPNLEKLLRAKLKDDTLIHENSSDKN